MINIENINKSEPPYNIFESLYKKALHNKQQNPEAACISSFNSLNNEIESRFVNIKYIINNEWIFFSNYNSQKAKDFNQHDQISSIFYWNQINSQIRIKAKIKKTSKKFSDMHFSSRNINKNALAVSSYQSKPIDSYDAILENYKKTIENKELSNLRPEYWGGYAFTPYYFEFWVGHESRINKREVFEMTDGMWKHSFLQP